MSRILTLAALALTLVGVDRAGCQSWRLRFDAAAQRVQFRGITADSIPESTARTSATGGLETPDGFAVDCIGDGYCRFYRPGAIATGVPASAGVNVTLWGLGIEGLSVHGSARLQTDLSGDRVWPGMSPALRVVEAYAEYIRGGLTAQGGRMLDRGRLASAGTSGIDGARITWRPATSTLDIGGYAGWGMARGTVLPVTSPAVNPLDDFQPTSRQVVLGLLAGAHWSRVDLQGEYRRELDPQSWYIVAERVALSAQGRVANHLNVVGGIDYDIAQGTLGSAEASASYATARVSGVLAARHYRPFFDLWTVWGVFSPVPFNSVSGSLTISPITGVQLRSRLEWFRYDNADVSTPLVTLRDRGWRWAVDATVVPIEQWTLDLGAHGERQPGASSSGVDGRISWHAASQLDLAINGGSLARPLELRFQDAGVTYAGMSAGYRVGDRWRLDAAIDRYWESRDRPDAGGIDWNQWRLSARASLTLRSAADRWLPPARPMGSNP